MHHGAPRRVFILVTALRWFTVDGLRQAAAGRKISSPSLSSTQLHPDVCEAFSLVDAKDNLQPISSSASEIAEAWRLVQTTSDVQVAQSLTTRPLSHSPTFSMATPVDHDHDLPNRSQSFARLVPEPSTFSISNAQLSPSPRHARLLETTKTSISPCTRVELPRP